MTAERRWSPTTTAAWTRSPSGAAVVMDMSRGLPLELSPSGSAVWEELLGGADPHRDLGEVPPRAEGEIVAALATDFGVGPELIREDVLGFLAMLETHGVAVRL